LAVVVTRWKVYQLQFDIGATGTLLRRVPGKFMIILETAANSSAVLTIFSGY